MIINYEIKGAFILQPLLLFKLYGPFLWMESTTSRLEPLHGGSLLFTIKFPEIPGTYFIDLGKLSKG